jgi:voltage-gated potassium channel
MPHRPPDPPPPRVALHPIRERLWRIVFRSDTRAGRLFDLTLLWIIAASVLVVMLESVPSLRLTHGQFLRHAEWFFTIVFTIEYAVRLAIVRSRARYARSFFGVVDLLSILPSYLELFVAGSHYLLMLRVLRMLRMFRVLHMAQHVGEASVLMNALRASRAKILVFLFSVMALVCVEGTVMYILETAENPGFNSIPQSIYWGIVTLTTVGYGDVSPVTVLGKVMASIIMLTGFAIIAVPTGVVTAELGREIGRSKRGKRACVHCSWDQHDPRARFCQQCGEPLG